MNQPQIINLKKNSNSQVLIPFNQCSSEDFIILEELGKNHAGGRTTYKAKHLETGQVFVIKEFQFFCESWKGYGLIEKEIKTLSNIDHHNIPKYLGKYETENSVCLIQEYIKAPSLATYRKLPLKEIKEIALNILDILVYLQRLNPPIFHRDIKPENLLYNQREKKVYLIDFGLAKMMPETQGASTTMGGGTLGFMPPEQLLGRDLTPSSDLYSLGMTLICLLSGISSGYINQIINEDFQVDFSKAVPTNITWEFRDWLKKVANPKISQRFSNADEAKEALEKISMELAPVSSPQISSPQGSLEKKSQKYPLEEFVKFGGLVIVGVGVIAVSVYLVERFVSLLSILSILSNSPSSSQAPVYLLVNFIQESSTLVGILSVISGIIRTIKAHHFQEDYRGIVIFSSMSVFMCFSINIILDIYSHNL